MKFKIAVFFVVPTFLLLVAVLSILGISRSRRPVYDVELVPSTILLGHLKPGQSRRTTALLKNNTSLPVTVSLIESSCPCVSANLAFARIDPWLSSVLTVDFKPEEPEFHGKLNVHLSGIGPQGRVLFATTVFIEID